jgi:nucleoside phosphorylase
LEGAGCPFLAFMPMLIISAALYSEAKPFIEFFNLKKDLSFSSFQVFRKEDTSLYITGTGPMEAAIVTSSFLTREAPAAKDLFLNVGICGSRRKNLPLGTPVLCNKLIELETGRTYFPDVLYAHPFMEGSIITSAHRQTLSSGETAPSAEATLSFADMEAAAIYQAGSYFFESHQMLFIKIISDYLIPDTKAIDNTIDISGLIGCKVKIIGEWITGLMNKIPEKTNDFTREEAEYIQKLSDNLKLSVTMEHELRQYLLYYKLVNGEFLLFIRDLTRELPLPVTSKTEGKKYLDYFKKNLL